ncbi:hypothetical protein Zm00014a_033966 [Zea mays]|uniref:Uncharacterized protein n=1 Tax=Zea mays TaxID=4577 RepID=A0A3L6GBS2_MAIZE|nr:hypothetical protein Zm00014a_033966 [Zea mays]
MYMMYFFSTSRGVLKKLDFFRSRFIWQGDKHKKKYCLARWNILRLPKNQGGLGIHDPGTKNTTLLGLVRLFPIHMDWMGLEKIVKKFDLFGIETHPIPLNPHGLRANRTSP